MNANEQELVRRAKQGDENAFGSLFRQYQDTMYRLALHFTGSADAAADVTQETFVKAWEKLPGLRNDRAFGGWLRSILLNFARDALRSAPPETRIEDDPRGAEGVADDGARTAEDVAQRDSDAAVRRAVMSLPEHQRTVVLMHHLEGMSVEEIMDALGLKKGTVISRLARGRDLLKRKLERNM
ncbi:MAG: sigma-70 family RNA polymerase sigma factor [Armatimonadetes bacterium]|jgi:RNA polymerase sigma-70 factor (ECF subfamily)|nr:sigma-70 family RNA polymerase sigma factor [Armatimonadota bacterium]